MATARTVVLAHVVVALLLGWVYFRRYRIVRPPIGVFDLLDIAMMIGGIILIPFVYLLLPHLVVLSLLILGAGSGVYFALEPVLRWKWLVWAATLLLVGLDVVLAQRYGVMNELTLLVHYAVALLVTVVGITNLWAQSGMKARDAAILGALLLIYDYVATSVVGQMDQVFERLAGLPLVPLFAWTTGDGGWLSLGLGDVLMATVFPLALRKAYGRQAGLIAMALALLTLMLVMLSPLERTFPVMVVLGPLMVVQYTVWRWRHGVERTTRQYLQAEPAT